LASTVDLRWVIDASRRWFVWPHLRTHVNQAFHFGRAYRRRARRRLAGFAQLSHGQS